MTNTNTDQHAIILTRVFDAPVELFYKAWTEPEHIEQWWGPEGFTTRVEEYDLRVGGKSKLVMTGPDGTEYPVNGVFLEVIANKKIVSTDDFGDEYKEMAEQNNIELPKISKLTLNFEDINGKTRLTLIMSHATQRDKELHEKLGVESGWNSSFDCLDKHLAKIQS